MLRTLRAGEITHPSQVPGFLDDNALALPIDIQRAHLLPLIEARDPLGKFGPTMPDILDGLRAVPGVGDNEGR